MSIDLRRIGLSVAYTCALVALAVPLYVNSNMYFPYISSKALAFRAIISLAVLAWVVGMFLVKREQRQMVIDRFSVLFAIYLIVMIVASVLGINWSFSFWSSVERSEGLLFWIHLLAFYLLLRNVITTEKRWLIAIDTFFIIAQAVVVIGYMQLWGVSFINTSAGGERIASTIGNAAFLAGYLLFAVWFGVHQFIKRKNIYIRWLYLIAVMADLFMIFQTGTRGAYLACLITVFLFVVILLLVQKNKQVRQFSLAFLACLLLVTSLTFVYRDRPFIKKSFILSRLTSISFNDYTAQTRLMAWESAWKGFLDRPLLGYGQEHYSVPFNKYFNPKIFRDSGSQIWFDRAHNMFIDHLVTGGAIGFIMYLIMLVYPFFLVIRKIVAKGASPEDRLLNSAIGLAFVAFFIQGLLVFESLPTLIALVFLWAFVTWRFDQASVRKLPSFVGTAVSIMLISLIGFTFERTVKKEYNANKLVVSGIQKENDTASYDQAYNEIKKAILMRTSGTQEYRIRLAEYVDGLILKKLIDQQTALAYVGFIDDELNRRLIEFPEDVPNYILLMRHYNYTYIFNPDRSKLAIEIGNRAIPLSPTRPQIYTEIGYAYYNLYDTALKQSKKSEAESYLLPMEEQFRKAIDLNPLVTDSYVNMVIVLLARSSGDKVQRYIDAMQDHALTYDDAAGLRMANAAVNGGQFDWAATFYRELSDRNPLDPQYLISLALSYAKQGLKTEAIATAERIKVFGGEYILQSVEFIKQVKAGTLK